MTQLFFKRYEKKYLLSNRQYDALTDAFSGRLAPDINGEYMISNIYYDTDDFKLVRMSNEKPVYKEKLRLRSYGDAADGNAFIELKKKYEDVVYKRREEMRYEDAVRFLESGVSERGEDSQVLREIAYFLSYHRVSPKVLLSYNRKAFSAPGDDGLRVTFDFDVRFRTDNLRFDGSTCGTPILQSGTVLMEIKSPLAVPLWLCGILSKNGIYPASFSKYGICYRDYIANINGRSVISA
jgi:hypothetical protein